MENVPRLRHERVFSDFVNMLESAEFDVFHDVVNCADYGVPQNRKRLVLIASRLGPIDLIDPITPEDRRRTVRQVIGDLPALSAGETSTTDALHRSSKLSPLNLRRIRASTPGGTWRDWDWNLRSECHKRDTGKSYPGVYARMSWDEPAPTMTTQFFGFGNGRFGHPEQDRGISLREGATLQSFPENYTLVPDGDEIHMKRIGRLIGNAVPVALGQAIGTSIIRHVEAWSAKRDAEH